MKIGLLAGNRDLPLLFASQAKKNNLKIVGICFKGETNPEIVRLVDRSYWVDVGRLEEVIDILRKEDIKECVMVGQISPWRIFKRSKWDNSILEVVEETDFRPHSIFSKIISLLEREGFKFLDSTSYLKDSLAHKGVMNKIELDRELLAQIEWGLKIVSRYVELDVGQTLVIKNKAVVAIEALEGTDRTITRAYKIAGRDCLVFKFSKREQDLRFDVPVVGIGTLRLLRKIKAKALILEEERVIILDKKKFLNLADKWGISIIGERKVN
ncbi:MAG: UDP-2,3-diacylglucosamine diphosphatase LpxI [Candidatus Omnitrophica bacterium]|nr:UDP-2,3-diacylglucosamine diphosphatase LpxI [Candidatus Omnitrophota bacterium]